MNHLQVRADLRRPIPFADGSMHSCVTSPPYWKLRDYGTNGQLGQESTIEEYIHNQVKVFREVKRILRDDGTFFLNIGTTAVTKRIESQKYTLRDDLTDCEYHHAASVIAKIMLGVWTSDASSIEDMPVMLPKINEDTRSMPEMRKGNASLSEFDRDGERQVLFKEMRPVGISNEDQAEADGSMPCMRPEIREVESRDCEERQGSGFLQSRLLVRSQSGDESCSLGRGPARTDVSPVSEMEKDSPDSRSGPMSDMSFNGEPGSSPHSTVFDSSGNSMESRQRPDSLSEMPLSFQVKRDGVCGIPGLHSPNVKFRLDISLNKKDIPPDILRYFKPVRVILPKNDSGVPWLLAMALRDDGWYLRSSIIWDCPNKMPESARDRPSKCHEYVFLLTKSPNYYWDEVAERKPQKTAGRRHEGKSGYREGHPSKGGISTRQLNPLGGAVRSVWNDIPNGNYKGAHFAIMPLGLAKRCISLGSSAHGVCSSCGAPHRQLIKRTRVPTRPGVDSKVAGTDGAEHGNRDPQRHTTRIEVLGWRASCTCNAPLARARIFDPYGGAGTTIYAAESLGRAGFSTELSAEYTELARQRLSPFRPTPIMTREFEDVI